jgi:NADPH:quinone reductase-like Zn-dependent oxidoreductase
MRAVRVEAYGPQPELSVREVATPRPGHGQVLVRMNLAPVHPFDIAFCKGEHGFRKPLPAIPGFEGVGVVVAAGGGIVPNLVAGRRVACVVGEHEAGTWAEYAVVDAGACMPVWNALSDEAASTLSLYPVAALGLLDELRAGGHDAAVLVGAGSLGRILLQLALAEGFRLVSVVRGAAEAEEVRAMGGTDIVDMLDPEFDAKLRRAVREHRATAAVDAVGGSWTARVLAALPDGADAIVCGFASGEPLQIDPRDLVFRRLTVRGFLVSGHRSRRGVAGVLGMLPRLRRHANDALSIRVARRIELSDLPDVWSTLDADTHGGTVLVRTR